MNISHQCCCCHYYPKKGTNERDFCPPVLGNRTGSRRGDGTGKAPRELEPWQEGGHGREDTHTHVGPWQETGSEEQAGAATRASGPQMLLLRPRDMSPVWAGGRHWGT